MDKRNLTLMLLTTALVLGFVQYQQYIRHKNHWDEPQAPAQTDHSTASAQPGPQPGTAPGTNPATGQASGATGWQFVSAPAGGPSPLPATLGSAAADDRTYALQLNINPRGAGLSSVYLNQFKRPEDFRLPEKERHVYEFQTPTPDVPDSDPLATQWVNVNGATVNLLDAPWSLEPQASSQPAGGPASATYSTTLSNNNVPALKVSKTYTVYPINAQQGGKGYEVRLEYGLKNLTAGPLTVKTEFNGPTLPPKEGGRGADRQVLAGYRHDGDIAVVAHPVEEFKKDKQETLEVSKSDKGALAWVGPCSVYFDALVLPLKNDPAAKGDAAVGDFIEKVTAKGWKLADESVSAEDRPVTLTFETKGQALGPNQSVSLPMDVYFGPRWRKVLDDAHYAAIPRHYDAALVIKSGWCSACTFDWLIGVMVTLLTAFHWLAGGFAGHGDWGIAIIMLVGVVRLILHPITKKSQVQMMKMGKMGPEMERLKKKYADDKDELNRQMVQFYKAQGAAPILGCLPMFLQMPIWIALYSSLQTTFELRQSPFLWGFTWIHDLAKPDYLLSFSHAFVVPFVGWHVDGLNILPILLGMVFFFQQKYMTPPNPAMTEQQLQQQKMMQVMTPVLFPLMLYSGPSGLNLYIFASTLFGVIESKVIRRHIKEREEAEKGERVIVDAKPTRQGKRLSRGDAPDTEKGGIRGFWADLQAKVEEARREQERKGKNGRR